jgi:hypothetical protein
MSVAFTIRKVEVRAASCAFIEAVKSEMIFSFKLIKDSSASHQVLARAARVGWEVYSSKTRLAEADQLWREHGHRRFD